MKSPLEVTGEFYRSGFPDITRTVRAGGEVEMSHGNEKIKVKPDLTWEFSRGNTVVENSDEMTTPAVRLENLIVCLDERFMDDELDIEQVHRIQCVRCNASALLVDHPEWTPDYLFRANGWRQKPDGSICPMCAGTEPYAYVPNHRMEFVS